MHVVYLSEPSSMIRNFAPALSGYPSCIAGPEDFRAVQPDGLVGPEITGRDDGVQPYLSELRFASRHHSETGSSFQIGQSLGRQVTLPT